MTVSNKSRLSVSFYFENINSSFYDRVKLIIPFGDIGVYIFIDKFTREVR